MFHLTKSNYVRNENFWKTITEKDRPYYFEKLNCIKDRNFNGGYFFIESLEENNYFLISRNSILKLIQERRLEDLIKNNTCPHCHSDLIKE